MSYNVKSAQHQAIHSVGTGDVDIVILVLAGQTNSETTLDLSLPTSGGRVFYGARWSDATARAGYAMTMTMTLLRAVDIKSQLPQNFYAWFQINAGVF